MNNISLRNNKGFKWFNNKNIWVKGIFFDSKNSYYSDQNLVAFFENVKSKEDFILKIKEANGLFSVVVTIENKIFLASDTSRMFPLFYSFKNDNFNLSDDIEFLKEKLNITKINKQSYNEFLSAAHTFGNRTILEGIFQLQSNEYIIINENKISDKGFFFLYSIKDINKNSYFLQKKQAIRAFENAFERLIVSLNNKHVALPLSGGYDSRFIAVMLKKHNYKNVTCFTYGRKNNVELRNAKKTAEKLNFKWVFIEYNDSLFGDYLKTDIFKKYAHYVGKYSSMPLLQEYFAVKYLKDNKIIPDDSVFIPGHSGDLLGGSQFVKVLKKDLKTSQIVNLLYSKKLLYRHSIKINSKKTKQIISENLLNFDANFDEKLPYSIAEDYDIKEKIAKFIINSSSVYSFFEFEHRLPFWDKELMTFFSSVPYEYKQMKLLFDDILKNIYFAPHGLNFDLELQVTKKEIFIQQIKNKVKLFLPYSFNKKLLRKRDSLNSFFATNQMIKVLEKNDLQYKTKIKSYNEIIIQWYLYFSEGLLKND